MQERVATDPRNITRSPASKIPQKRGLIKAAWSTPIWVKLFLFSLMLPVEFSLNIGPLRLSPYRLVLLAAFLPALSYYLSRKDIKFSLPDGFVITHLLWCVISISVVHGFAQGIEIFGGRILDFGGAYLIARAYIRDLRSFDSLICCSVLIIILLLPFLLIEMVTGYHLIRSIAASIVGSYFHVEIGLRLGMTRAMGPFEHPILMGVFMASLLSPIWVRYSHLKLFATNKLFLTTSVFVAAFSSLSSAPILVLVGQIGLHAWNYLFRKFKRKWLLLILLFVSGLIVIEIFSNRSALKVLITYMTFSSHTAYYRLAIYDAGMDNVWANPIFGIGLNDWVRPDWMAPSVDSFWLLLAMQFGIPGFLSFVGICWVSLKKANSKKSINTPYKLSWTIALVSIIIAGFTVHYWNSMIVYIALLLGASGWFSSVKKRKPIKAVTI